MNTLNLTNYYSKTGLYSIPVLADVGDLEVNLYLTSHQLGSTNRFGEVEVLPNSTVIHKLPFQYKVGDKFLYSSVLSANVFNHPNTYYGYIVGLDRLNQTKVFEQNIIFNLLENPLDTASPYNYNNINLTRGDIIDILYNSSLVETTEKTNDGEEIYIVINDSTTDRPLPIGSYARIYKKSDPSSPIVINGREKIELSITNQFGVPLDSEISIANKQSSYLLISGLKSGQYYAKIYTGVKQVAGPIEFYYK